MSSDHARVPGRPPAGSARRSRVVTVSLPPELADEFERIADEEQRTRSELFREMLREYSVRRALDELTSLQEHGAGRAAGRGVVTEEEVIAIVTDEREHRTRAR